MLCSLSSPQQPELSCPAMCCASKSLQGRPYGAPKHPTAFLLAALVWQAQGSHLDLSVAYAWLISECTLHISGAEAFTDV